jgi:hypothetical protein
MIPLVLTLMLTAALPAYAGPAAKLSRQLGITKSQARALIRQGITHRSAGAAPAIPGAPSTTQGIPMGAGAGPAR